MPGTPHPRRPRGGQAGEKARRKFSSTGGKAPELPTLTGPFPNDQANVGS